MKETVFFLRSRGARKLSFMDIHIVKTDSIQKLGNVTGNVTIGNVRAASSDYRILKQTDHNMHGPDIPQIEVQQSMASIREAASKTQEAPVRILNKELT